MPRDIKKDRKRKKISSSSSDKNGDSHIAHGLCSGVFCDSAINRQQFTMSTASSASGDEDAMSLGTQDKISPDSSVSRKLDFIIQKLDSVEQKLEGKIFDIEKRIDELPTKQDYSALKEKLNDQANRLRRNNIILHNVPEKVEGNDCIGFVRSFITDHMELEKDSIGEDKWEIDRAHRTGPPRENHTRPIHVRFLRYQDRVLVLKAAPSKLKDNPFTPIGKQTSHRVYISDDVTEEVRKQRKKLVVLKKAVQNRWPDRKVFIPPSVPAILLREGEDGRLIRMLPGDEL